MACISINALENRKSAFTAPDGWMLDSGAFTILNKHGYYPQSPYEYALRANRWRLLVANLLVIVAQDYMCEPFVLTRTGLTVAKHQRLTIERYDELVWWWNALGASAVPVMPVLQGFEPEEYVAHLHAYGDRITPGMWVGVGSVCKRQGDPGAILRVLRAIKAERPDLRLHGFGVKLTALAVQAIRCLLHSADSMAWSFAARKQGRDANSPVEALAFHSRVTGFWERT